MIRAARTATDADPAQDDVTRTLALVERLLDRGFRVGEIPEGVSFVAWTSQDRRDIKRRIERDWQALGRDPNLWEICWFDLPKDRLWATTCQQIERFVGEAEIDPVGLWEIMLAAERTTNLDAALDGTERTLSLVALLLGRSFRATDLACGGKYIPWADQDHPAVLQRIQREWHAHGREPNPNDICWFDLPADRR